MARHDRQRARIGVDPNYSLAKRKPAPHAEQARTPVERKRMPIDDLIDAPYPRVDPEQAIEAALARVVGATNSS